MSITIADALNALTIKEGKAINFDTLFTEIRTILVEIYHIRLNINSRFCQGQNVIDFVKIVVQLRPFIYKGSKKEIYLRCE